jgi:SNF2 family DNA or RNA helicase
VLISEKHQKIVLNLSEPSRVMTVIPSARLIQYRGKELVAVPHRNDEVRVLRNLGIDAPAPITKYYDWPGRYPPFIHQKITAEFLTLNPYSYCLNGMGSGKTLASLWSYDFLKRQGVVRRMLVIAPLSTLERTWGDEIFCNFPELTFTTLHGTKDKRLKLINTDFDIYIINHDGIKSAEVLAALCERHDIDIVCVDEFAAFRNSSTSRWKALQKLIKGRMYVWGMTGTPTPKAPTDAWAQCKLISPRNVPPYFGAFRELVMRQSGPYKWLPRDNAMEIVSKAMQPAIRFSREECIDLPPTTYTTRQVEMTLEQLAMYKDMLKRLQAEFGENQVTAVNEAVKAGKLLQIACGAVYGNNGETIVVPSGPRIEALKEFIEESGSKVIVFVPYTRVLQNLADELSKEYSVAVIHGQVSKTERDKIFHDFQKRPDPHVLVANPGAMSHGLTLTAASTIVWYAPTMSNEIYEQANARIVRPGQKLNTLIAHLEGSDIERRAYDRLKNQGKMQGLLLDILKGK